MTCLTFLLRDSLLDAARFLPAEQIQAAPDCGMVTLDQATARRKLAAMVKGAAMAEFSVCGASEAGTRRWLKEEREAVSPPRLRLCASGVHVQKFSWATHF